VSNKLDIIGNNPQIAQIVFFKRKICENRRNCGEKTALLLLPIKSSILVRKVIQRGNFTSVKDLKRKVMAFIEYYNRTMAKPFKWTYQGKALTA